MSNQLYLQPKQPSKTVMSNGETAYSDAPQVQRIKISLDIDTGNVIYQEFDNLEDAMEFVTTYAQDPDKILDKITPRALRRK